MNRTNLEHAVAALLIMGAVWGLMFLLALPAGHLIGAAAGVAFFAGREYTQAEREIAKAFGVYLVELRWYYGLDLRLWSRDALLDLVFPLVACLAVVLLVQFLPVALPLLL